MECLFLSAAIVKNCGLILLQELLVPLLRVHLVLEAKHSHCSCFYLAVVDTDFQTASILVERLPIAKYMNKTYREALNLNNRKVWTKWSDVHGRLHDYY